MVVADCGGKNHEKGGFPENAGKKPLRVFYLPSEAYWPPMVVESRYLPITKGGQHGKAHHQL
jgi:hypothetical protein